MTPRLALAYVILASSVLMGPVRANVGRVIDAADNAALSDVDIATVWSGFVYQIVQSTHTCFHLDLVSSDQDGSFKRPLSAPAPRDIVLVYDVRSRVVVYRKGYKAIEPASGFTIRMKRDASPSFERMRYVVGLAEQMLCGSEDERRVLIPVFKRMYEEMNGIPPRSTRELKLLSNMQYIIDELELEQIAATKRWNQRKEAWGIK